MLADTVEQWGVYGDTVCVRGPGLANLAWSPPGPCGAHLLMLTLPHRNGSLRQ